MKLYQYIGVLLCVVMGSKSESSDVFKGVVQPVLDDCRSKVEFTDADYNSVLNMEPPFSPAAMCLIDCGMTELNLLSDGQVTAPEEYMVGYTKLYSDDEQRMADPEGVVQTCYDEISGGEYGPCEIGVAMLDCTRKETYGE